LRNVFDVVEEVDLFDSKDEANLALIKRPELGVTFTKLSCWKLTQFDKCVFLDADVLVVQNCDDLFDWDELSAAPDVGWPDCFNSGVFVFKPNLQTYSNLLKFASERGSFDGGDQGLLNLYFADWRTNAARRLPFIYNTSISTVYSYLPAFKQFQKEIKIIHFLGPFKPWHASYNFNDRTVTSLQSGYQHLLGYLEIWWNLLCETVHPQLKEDMAGLAGSLARSQEGTRRTPDREAWQEGHIDYMGVDSFSNILSKIEETLEKKVSITEDVSKVEEVPKVVPKVTGTTPKEVVKIAPKEPIKTVSKEAPKEAVKPAQKEAPKEIPKPAPKEAPKEMPKPAPKEVPKETPKPAPKEAPKETPKPAPKEAPKLAPKEVPKASPKEAPKPIAKEPTSPVTKEAASSTAKEAPKEATPKSPTKAKVVKKVIKK
jgi:glycogenin glucosyltransferase